MNSSLSRDDSENQKFKFDVFLSFRGTDTSETIIPHLFSSLNRKGLSAFRDDVELQRGEAISDQLLKAIEDSRSSVVFLSQNYASSPWCLDGLVKILECKNATGQIVLPVFYNVEPSDVRRQMGSFRDAFDNFGMRGTDPAKVQKWRAALTEVATLPGCSSMNEHEASVIEGIVNHLFTTLGN